MKLRFYVLLFALFSLSACKIQDEFDDLKNNYHPEIAVPLFYAKTSFKDIIGNKASALKVDNSGKMRLYYKGTVSERKAVDALKIFPSSGIQVLIPDTSVTQAFPGDLDLYIVDLSKKALLTLACQPPSGLTKQIVEGSITFPNFTKNGVPFKYVFSQEMTGNTPVIFGNFPLEGYRVNFDANSKLTFKYQAKTKADGKNLKMITAANLQNVGFTYCEAYMKKQDLQLNAGSVDLDFYDEQVQGSINFEDPRITIIVDNSYGFPMQTKINYVKAVNVNNDTVQLNAIGLTGGVGFPFPFPKSNEVGQTKSISYDFTNKTSNIKDMLNSKPVTILYDIDAIANPDNIQYTGFITDSTTLKIGIEVDIPLYGTSKDFVVKDEFKDIDFQSALTNITEAELKFVSDNALPVEVLAQIDFLDSNGKVLTNASDTPFKLVQAASIDSKGNVTKTAVSETFVKLNATKTELLRRCTKAQIKFYFSTSNNGTVPVSILSTQEVNIKMGVRATIK
jgi:hypothetical protein